MSVMSKKPLTAEEYYQRALKAMSMEPGDEQIVAVGEVDMNVAFHRVRLSREQAMDIKTRAMALFHSGNAEPLLGFRRLFTVAEVLNPERGFWASIAQEHEGYWELGCGVSLLREAGILESDEKPIAVDFYFMEVGNRGAPRIGIMVLTDRRLLLEGLLSPPHQYMPDAYRLYYEDHEAKHWLYFVDYLMLDRVVSIESRWGVLTKSIVVEYQTKYVKESFHTLFGPYFFKWKLPPMYSASEGVLKVYLTPSPGGLGNPHLRQEELVKRIQDAKAALSAKSF